jgi:hypothetical protein
MLTTFLSEIPKERSHLGNQSVDEIAAFKWVLKDTRV